MRDAAELLLMAAVIPLWILAGLVDWACHRATRIEATSGLPENLFHWLLLAQMGVAMLAILLLEITAGVLLLALAAFLLHEISVYVELRYTVARRFVRPFEQMVHSYMELLALVAIALLATMRWDQVLALVGPGEADLGLRWKAQPWPPAYVAGALAAAAVLNVVPLAEETARCWRFRRSRGASAG